MNSDNGSNRAIVTVYKRVGKVNHSPSRYIGVVELSDYGFSIVEIVLQQGVRDFPQCPYMATVPCADTFVEFRKGLNPLLNINEWEELRHFYC